MSFINILYAIAGGIFGALIGGTNAFIFTGFVGLIGIAASLAGQSDFILNQIAFGPFLVPAVTFGGAVAATAYAGMKSRKGKLIVEGENVPVEGANMYMPMFKTKSPDVLIVAGVFGALGWALTHLFMNVWNLPLDAVSLVVLISNMLSRLLFTNSGIVPEYPEGETRFGILNGKYMFFTALWSFFLAFAASYVSIETGFNNVIFCISAMSLIFGYHNEFTSTHHVTMTAGFAAIVSNNIWYGAVFGLIAGILAEYIGRLINTHADSHLDREATTITICSLVASLLAKAF